ncbi:chaperone NapD, partial [Acinetobacter baumannii]
VVTEAPDAGSLGTMLNTIQSLRDVYSAALVFHAIET